MVCWCLLLCYEFCNEAQRQSTCHVRPSVSPPPCRRDQEDPLLKATTGPAKAIEPLDPSDPTLMRAHISNVKVVGMPYTQVGGPPPVVVAVAAGGQTALGGIRKTNQLRLFLQKVWQRQPGLMGSNQPCACSRNTRDSLESQSGA